MAVLVYLGRVMERVLGHWRFLLLYTVGGISGGIFFQVTSTAPMVVVGLGASGAVYGVFAAFLVIRCALKRGGRLPPFWSFLFWAGVVIVLDQAFALLVELGNGAGVAASAHVGGFVSGAVLGFSWLSLFRPATPAYRGLRLAAQVSLVVLLVGLSGYGYLYTREERDLQALAANREIQNLLEQEDYEGVLAAWREHPARGDSNHRLVGYLVFDELMAQDRVELANEFLDDLLELGFAALKAGNEDGAVTPDLLNEVAWLCAMRGKHLLEARELADHAVRAADSGGRGGPWSW